MIKYHICQSLDEVKHLKTNSPTFADIETNGLYINTRLVQVFQPDTDETIYILDTDILQLDDIKAWLKPLWTIWQGCTYDFGTLNITTAQFDDTLYLARSAYPEWREFKLDNIVNQLGYEHLYDGLDKKELQKLGFAPGAYLSQVQLQYAATDVYALWMIWQDKRIQEARNKLSYKIDIMSVKYSIEYQQNELVVHQPSVRKELDSLVEIIASNEIALGGLNPNSPKQVKEYLGTPSSNKETLIKLIGEGNHMAELVFKQRRLLKRRTFLNSYNYPKVITRFNPAGAATGRFTSTGGDLDRGINAQQITRGLQYMFHQPTEDTSVVHADYSTAELRAGCSIMRDSEMYSELRRGLDLHRIAATFAIDKDPSEITKAERQKGKAISFGFIFGMSAASFQEYAYTNYDVRFTLEECQAIKHRYSTKYQGINAYHKQMWNNYKSTPVETPTGRRNMARLGTDAINYATQGAVADTVKLAVRYLCREYEQAVKYIFNVVHDAVYLRVPKGDETLWADRLAAAMLKAWVEICKCEMFYYKDIPMPVEVEWVDPITNKEMVKEYV